MRDNNKILLVEDNPDDVNMTLFAFKQAHIANEIVVAQDGSKAIDYLFGYRQENDPTRSTVPLLIILDLRLPGMDGKEVLKRIRTDPKTKHVPVVVLTSSDEEADINESYSLGANSYIRKPVELSRFTEAVKHVGLYWLALNEAPNQQIIK
jgi:two-component system, response regulator